MWIIVKPWMSRSTKHRMRTLGSKVMLRGRLAASPRHLAPAQRMTQQTGIRPRFRKTQLPDQPLRSTPHTCQRQNRWVRADVAYHKVRNPRFQTQKWAWLGMATQPRPQGPRELIPEEE